MGEAFEIRAAAAGDLEAVNELYNYYVRETHVTFDIDPITMPARREWFTHYGTTGRYRLLVAATSTPRFHEDSRMGAARRSRLSPTVARE